MSAALPQVLIVDDNHELADNIAELLEDAGYGVTVAFCGVDALALAATRHFDAVLADIRMPGMNGVELIQRLRAVNADATCLLMTAYASDVVLSEAVRSGVQTILHKPFDLPTLLHALPREARAVLLVEGNRALADVVRDALLRRGYRVRSAEGSGDARRAISESAPDAVILDVEGGDPEWLGLARELVGQRIPVVLLGSEERELSVPALVDAVRPDALRFLVKPFDTERLLAALGSLLPAREGAA